MADTGGMLTRDRIEAVRQAADRLAVMRDMIATQQAADAWNESQEVIEHEEHITDCKECFYCDKEDRWCLKFDLVNMHDGFYCSDAKRKEGDET